MILVGVIIVESIVQNETINGFELSNSNCNKEVIDA